MRWRIHPLDGIILLLVAILVPRQWPGDPGKLAWKAGYENMARGEFSEAVDRFDQVLAERPDFDRAYFFRGFSLYYLRRHAEAAQDFDAGLALGGDPYMLFWRYMAKRRIGVDGAEELRAGLRQHSLDVKAWPGVLGAALLNEATAESVLDAAGAAPPERQAGWRTEAHFYLGQRHLLEGRREAARAHFMKAVEAGAVNYMEHGAAVHEIKDLDAGH